MTRSFRCFFCNAPASEKCEAATEAWKVLTVAELKPGDRIRFNVGMQIPNTTGNPNGPVSRKGTVIDLEVRDHGHTYVAVRHSERRGDVLKWGLHQTALVDAMRPAKCGNAVCEVHQRDMGDKIICQSHWRAWEEVS